MRGGLPFNVWQEILEKEEKWDDRGLVGRGYAHNCLLQSDNLKAALGGSWHDQSKGVPGQAAAIAEALRDASASKAIHEASARRIARASKGRTGVLPGQKFSQGAVRDREMEGLSPLPPAEGVLTPRTPRPIQAAVGAPKASRTDPSYMKQSPTYQHAGDLNWFAFPRQQPHWVSKSLAAAGSSAATGGPSPHMDAAGRSLAAVLEARDANRMAIKANTESGQRRFEQMGGRDVKAGLK